MMLSKYMTIYHNSNADNGRLIDVVVDYANKNLPKYDLKKSDAILEQVLFVEERLMDYDRAYKILEEVLEIRKHNEPVRLDDVYNGYLFLCGDACKYTEMEHWLNELKNSKEPIVNEEGGGWGYRPYALACFEAVLCIKHRGDYERGEQCIDAAWEILKSRPPIYSVSSVLNWQGQLKRRQGKLQEAKQLFEQALEKRLLYYGPQHIEVIKIVENLAIVLEQINPKDPEIATLRKQAYEFRKNG